MNYVRFVLEINNEKFFQSRPITRYLARRYNLIGKNELEAYRCDALVDAMQDLRDAFHRGNYQF